MKYATLSVFKPNIAEPISSKQSALKTLETMLLLQFQSPLKTNKYLNRLQSNPRL